MHQELKIALTHTVTVQIDWKSNVTCTIEFHLHECMDRKLSSAIESLHRAIEQATKYPVACQQYTPVNNEATDSLQKNTCAYSQFALKAHTGESLRRVKNDTYFNMVKQGSILRETKNFLPNFRWSIKKSNIQLKHG
jgi:hypothetical protein